MMALVGLLMGLVPGTVSNSGAPCKRAAMGWTRSVLKGATWELTLIRPPKALPPAGSRKEEVATVIVTSIQGRRRLPPVPNDLYLVANPSQ